MDDKVIKMALSYALASDLHEAWRAPRKREDGTYEPRIKNLKMKNGTLSMELMK